MALVTDTWTFINGGVQMMITYDDVDRLVRTVHIINNSSQSATIRVLSYPAFVLLGSWVAQPGVDQTWNIPANQRPNYDQNTIQVEAGI